MARTSRGPNLLDAEPSEALSEWQLKIAALVERLTTGVPDEPAERTADAARALDLGPLS